MPVKILFVDDDIDIQVILSFIIERAGMQISCAGDGEQALEQCSYNPYDLILLDVMLPGMDGLETCRRIRQSSDVPIILLSARSQEQDVVAGLGAGADDYITKPFRQSELLARIQSVLNRGRRNGRKPHRQLSFKDLVLDLEGRRVILHGKPIGITTLEYQLLQYLMQNTGTVLTKPDLLQNVWGFAKTDERQGVDLNLVEAAIRRLRKKLDVDPSRPAYIKTVWGAGYRFGE